MGLDEIKGDVDRDPGDEDFGEAEEEAVLEEESLEPPEDVGSDEVANFSTAVTEQKKYDGGEIPR